MVFKNIVLTLLVGGAAAAGLRDLAPAGWSSIRMVGLGLATIAFALWTLARFQLGNSLTVTAQAKQLVNRGLYSKIRNPIYFFGSLFIAGFFLVLGRPKWLFVFLAVIPLQIWRISVESKVLEEKFGEEYRNYRAATWF